MKITKKAAYTLIKSTEDSVKEFVTIFKEKHTDFSEDHIIIDFSEKVSPVFTPDNLLDNNPLIKKNVW